MRGSKGVRRREQPGESTRRSSIYESTGRKQGQLAVLLCALIENTAREDRVQAAGLLPKSLPTQSSPVPLSDLTAPKQTLTR